MDELKIPISTPFKGEGAAAAKKAIQDLTLATNEAGKATKQQGTESKQTSSLLDQLGSRSGDAREAIEGLSRAADGGTASVFGIAKALKSVMSGLSLNPFSFLAGAALAAIPSIIKFAKELVTNSEDAAKKARAAFGDVKTAAEKLNEAKLDTLKAELDGVTERATAAEKMLQAVYAIQEKIAKAKEDLAIAEIEADPTLSPEEKKKRIYAVQKSGRAGDRQREDALANDMISTKQRAVSEAREVADRRAAESQQEAARLEQNRRAPGDRAIVEKELLRQIAEIISQRAQLGSGPDAFAKDEKLRREQGGLQEQYRYLKERDSVAATEPALRDAKSAEVRAQNAERAAKEAEERARKAEADLAAYMSEKALRDSSKGILRGLEDETSRVRAGVPLPPQAPRSATQAPGSIYIGPDTGGRAYGAEMQAAGEDTARRVQQAIRASGGVVGNAIIEALKERDDKIAEAIRKLGLQQEQQMKASRR